MTTRDRLALIITCTLAVLVAAWFLVVAPEREQASKLESRVNTASAQLASAEGELGNARGAEARYSSAYTSIVSLGKAVPPTQEIPSLVYQLDQASNKKSVEFSSIVSGAAGGPSGSSSAAASSATPAAATSSFAQMPFTFVFNGSFFDLEHLFQQLNRFTLRTASGDLQISGRLLTIQSVRLAPLPGSSTAAPSSQLNGTITATAYVLPASQGLTGGVTPSSPTGAGSQAASASSPTTPAIVRVTP
jgi:Tfp pilus assembly protein PilO